MQSSDDSFIQAAANARAPPWYNGREPDNANSASECVTGNYNDDNCVTYGLITSGKGNMGYTDCLRMFIAQILCA